MRVIKFRGYCSRDSEWRFGSYATDGENHEILTVLSNGSLYASAIAYDDIDSIGQFTGLLDKNGVEIYEGDIVRLWYAPLAAAIGFVSFDNGGFVFNTEKATPNKSFVGECVDCGNYFTVIGNIHETPELLK